MQKFLFLFLILVSTGISEIIEEGPYTFNIEAVNRWNMEIERVRFKVDLDGNRAMIKARSRGYRATRVSMDLQEGKSEYDVTVTLREPWIDLDVKTTRGEHIFTRIKNRGNQVPGDKYSVEITILEMDFKYFTPWDVKIEIDNWPLWRADVDVDGLIFGRKVIITFDRKELRHFNNDILVKIPKDGERLQHREEMRKKLLFSLQNKVKNPHSTREDVLKKLGELGK